MDACCRARVVVALLAALAWPAQAQDVTRSPACRTALAALNDAEDALAAAAGASAAGAAELERQRSAAVRLTPLRRQVADACLGGLTTSPPPSQHTWVVPQLPSRPAATAPRPPAGVPPVGVTVPPPQPPVMLGSCNGGTCTASDGSTLTRVGPNVMGPRGLCRVQGLFVVCP